MIKEIFYYSCLLMMLVAFVTSIVRWKLLAKPDKVISVLLACTFASEIISYLFMVNYKNNMYVYHIFSPIELSFVAFYYSQAIPVLKKVRAGLWVTAAGLLFAFANARLLQPINTFPSLFLLFQGFLIVILSLYSFFSIMYKEDYKLVSNVQFWISFNLLVFWSFTFLIWGTYISFSKGLQNKLPVIFNMLAAINFLEYFIFYLIFFFYPKMIRSGE